MRFLRDQIRQYCGADYTRTSNTPVFLKRTWAEISKSALTNNINTIKNYINKPVIAAVKANAYGHGDIFVSRILWENGVRFFAVSNFNEAVNIREILPEAEILLFGYTEPALSEQIIANNFIQTVGSTEYAERIGSVTGKTVRVHIKLDTGMGRAGVDTVDEVNKILAVKNLQCEALYTHFSVADSLDGDDAAYTKLQQEHLLEIHSRCNDKTLKLHSQNSGGVLYHKDFQSDFVRPGIILYGYKPNFNTDCPVKLSHAMTLKTVIAQIKEFKAGSFISYGRTYKTGSMQRLAVIPIGYADGLSRLNSDKGYVYVNNARCPIVGRVCMDQTVIDVSNAEANVDDEVIVYSDKFSETNIENIADRLGTIPYEVTCGVSARAARKLI
jgi:alanine racemase